MRAPRPRRLLGICVLISLALSACAKDAPLDTLDPAGRKADDIDSLIKPIFIICFVVLAGIFGIVGYIGWRFRVGKPDPDDEVLDGGYTDEVFPEQSHGNQALEIGWTAAPAIVMAVIAFVSVPYILRLDDVEASPNANYPELEIIVVGQQWWWEYHYYLDGTEGASEPDLVTANEMVIPVDQDVRIFTTSRDVIHSFWIPRLHGKKDSVPGRIHPWVMHANDVGRYAGQCTEFCGLSHAYMRMYTVAVTDDDFSAWVDNQVTDREPLQEGEPGYEGEQIFLQLCSRCHVIEGVTSRDRDGDGEPEMDDMAMYGNIEDFRDHSDGTFTQGMFLEPGNLTAGAAPNLTHFATRTSYAGSFFELYVDAQETADAGNYLSVDESDYYRGTLEAWLRNSPAEKPNAWENLRGMPNLNLDEAQIDALVDYLVTLD